MIPRALALAAALWAAPLAAQEAVEIGQGAVLRALDKITGDVTDFDLRPGATVRMGRIEISLGECRYPEGNPAGDAYAYLTVQEEGRETPVFSGWMIASSPALNALDHSRYDVWVLRCITA